MNTLLCVETLFYAYAICKFIRWSNTISLVMRHLRSVCRCNSVFRDETFAFHACLKKKANKGKSWRNLPHIPTRLFVIIARYFLKIRQVVAKEFCVETKRNENALKRESLIEYSGRDFSPMGSQNDTQQYLN